MIKMAELEVGGIIYPTAMTIIDIDSYELPPTAEGLLVKMQPLRCVEVKADRCMMDLPLRSSGRIPMALDEEACTTREEAALSIVAQWREATETRLRKIQALEKLLDIGRPAPKPPPPPPNETTTRGAPPPDTEPKP